MTSLSHCPHASTATATVAAAAASSKGGHPAEERLLHSIRLLMFYSCICDAVTMMRPDETLGDEAQTDSAALSR
jgi:hypothetical protein